MFGKYFWATSLVLPFAVFGQRPFEGCQTADVCSNVKCFDPDDPEVTCDGIVMPDFDYPCKCCPVTCIKYLKEGAKCIRSRTTPPNEVCGPGLTCTEEGDESFCQKFNKNCIRLRDVYDQEVSTCGPMGASGYRPYCDDLGDFEGKQCVSGSICYCVDKDGQRIDGEALESEAGGMDCKCTRDKIAIKELLGSRIPADVELPTCLTNGNYDPLQCSEGTCYCVGNATHPWPDSVPVSEEFFHLLPCYDSELHKTLPRDRPCTKRLKEYLETLQDPSNLMLSVENVPKCAGDGRFLAVQTQFDTKFCVDPEGNQIETFMGDTSTLAGQIMNCQCARSRFWASVGLGVMPTCCPNGNYMPWQCNGPVCTCVNLITGQPFGPIVEESSKNDLCCYNEDPCGIIPDFNECSSPPNLGC